MREKSEENLKTKSKKAESIAVKLTTKKIVVLLALASVMISLYLYFYFQPKEEHYAIVFGELIAFRADLNEANKVPVSPSETAVYFELFSLGDEPFVENITFAFKDAGLEGNPLYQLQIFELTTKLQFAYGKRYNSIPGFDCLEIEVEETTCRRTWPSYEKLPGMIQNPVIALVHPKFATETSIKLKNHVIYLHARNEHDVDLVTTKLLMIALDLKRV